MCNMHSCIHLSDVQIGSKHIPYLLENEMNSKRTATVRFDPQHQKVGDGSKLVLSYTIFGKMTSIWGFPKIGVPPNHPNFSGIFTIINYPFWAAP